MKQKHYRHCIVNMLKDDNSIIYVANTHSAYCKKCEHVTKKRK